MVNKLFKNHPGNVNEFWFATEYSEVIKLLDFFIKKNQIYLEIMRMR